MRKFSPKMSAVAVGLILALSTAGQARADWHDHDHDRYDQERHEREWREHEAREHYYGPPPVVYEAPRPVYYGPPPLVVGVPGINIVVPLRIR
jgi:hypothetical protein